MSKICRNDNASIKQLKASLKIVKIEINGLKKACIIKNLRNLSKTLYFLKRKLDILIDECMNFNKNCKEKSNLLFGIKKS